MAGKGMLNADEIEALLLEEPVGHLGLAKEGVPYLVPLNYIYCDEAIYFHCAPAGRKVEYIEANPKGCFQVGRYEGLIAGKEPCSHNYHYRSVIVEGVLEEIMSKAEKEAVLRRLTAKYAGNKAAEGEISAARIKGVALYRLTPATISGKRDS